MPTKLERETEELRDRVNELSNLYSAASSKQNQVNEYTNSLVEKLVKTVLDGNGRNSIQTELALIKSDVQNIKEKMNRESSKKWGVILACLSSGLALFVVLIEKILGAM